jgi:hypothetical protein
MNEYNDLSTYNGNTEHDMWVDFDNYENTVTLDVFDEDNLDEYVDNRNVSFQISNYYELHAL